MKKYSSKILSPIGRKCQNIPANYFTLASCLISIIAGIGYYLHNLVITFSALLFIEFFDQLDGIIARLQGPTKFGAFLDSTLDRYGDLAIIIGIWAGNYLENWFIWFILLGVIMTSYMRARIEALGIKSLGGVGLFERTDRIPLLLFGVIGQIFYSQSILISLIILAIGSNITAIQRFLFARKHLKIIQNLESNSQD
ncbi:CDP-alcohol phosphatidyltransferase family protein [Candidatus Harpocratesius sp.]